MLNDFFIAAAIEERRYAANSLGPYPCGVFGQTSRASCRSRPNMDNIIHPPLALVNHNFGDPVMGKRKNCWVLK